MFLTASAAAATMHGGLALSSTTVRAAQARLYRFETVWLSGLLHSHRNV